MELTPLVNHWWNVTFYLTARGLTTSPIPYHGGTFEVDFDFIDHNLFIQTSKGTSKAMPLIPRSVADFYREFIEALRSLNINVIINTLPSEVTNPIRCDEDVVHASYASEYAHRFWRILVQSDKVFKAFRSQFIGKSSPVHFFWGSFDLAVTRFSGQRAPERPGADRMTREGYSHEVISCGFWPGDDRFPEPAFYSYTSPEPPGLRKPLFAPVKHFIVPNCLYSSYDMMTFGTQASPKRRSWIFFKAPTKPERIWHIGIARHWKGRYGALTYRAGADASL